MIDFMNENPDVAIAGPKVLDEDGTIQGSARSFPTILTSIFGRKSPLTILFPNNSITRENILTGKSDGINPYPVDWVSGACMILRRDALARIGTFDEHFFMYWEDADICRRAKDAGYQVIYYPKPEVYHLVGKSSDTKPFFSILHFHRSCYCLFKKYSTWPVFLMTSVSIVGLASRCAIVILINSLDRLIQAKRKKLKRLSKVDDQYQTKKKILRVTSRPNNSKPSINVSFAGTIARIAALFYNAFVSKGVKIVHTVHRHFLEDNVGMMGFNFFTIIERMFARFTDKIIAVSTTQKWELVEKYQLCPPEKIDIINQDLPVEPFVESTKLKDQRKAANIAANIDDDDLLIGIIGRFSSRNNHRMFLESASYLYKQNPDLKAKFVVVGGGELKEELEAYVSRLGLSDQVIFTGWEKDLPSLYTDLDILALTSVNEGAPASIIEAMAAKVSVITTSGGGIKDLLGESDQEDTHKNGFNVCKRGILCPKNDPVVFAEGLEHLINNRSIDRNAKRTQKNP